MKCVYEPKYLMWGFARNILFFVGCRRDAALEDKKKADANGFKDNTVDNFLTLWIILMPVREYIIVTFSALMYFLIHAVICYFNILILILIIEL